MHHHIRLPPGHSSVCAYIDSLCTFIARYRFLIDFHAVDFFTHDYWNSGVFPAEWRMLKDDPSVTYDDLLHLASFGTLKDDWPESLKQFVALSRAMALPRDAVPLQGLPVPSGLDNKISYGMSPKKKHEVQLLAALIDHLASQSNITNIMDIGAGQGYLDACLAYTYQHTVIGVDDDEIQTCGAKRRSELIEKIFSSSKNRGKAVGKVFHINRRVGSGESFETLLREAEAGMAQGAVEKPVGRHAQALAELPFTSPPPPPPPPKAPPANAPPSNPHSSWLLCGLHACGDLSPALMRHFLNSDAKVLASVGCCYNHLSESAPFAISIPPDPSLPTPTIRAPPPRTITSTPRPRGGITAHSAGFPLSTHLNTRDCTLGFTARMAACQATCRWTDDPLASKQSFKRHHYRALLQKLIIEHKLMPNLDNDDDDEATRTITVGKIPRGAFENGFATYARAALVKLRVDVDDDDGGEKAATVVATDPAALAQYEREHESREKEIAVVWTLRAMLAEALESLILVDRFLALVEAGGETDVCVQDVVSPSTGILSHLTRSVDEDSRNGTPNRAPLQVALFPLFDHVSSPRNMVLICRKQT
ncbi:hypothetical protein HDU89_004390 [Geranomyces variabilis]|nr:hypothetical protein HDU89_004390 [Geranomyces variabilis]